MSKKQDEGSGYKKNRTVLSLMAALVAVSVLFSRGTQDIPFFFITGCLAALLGLWCLSSEHVKVRTDRWVGYAFIGLFAFSAWSLISLLWAYVPGHAAMHGLGWIHIALLAAFGYVYAARTHNGRILFAQTIVAVSALLAAYSIYLFANSNVVSGRLFYPFGLPNVNGGFFIVPFFLSIGVVLRAWLVRTENWRYQSIWLSCLVFISTALVLTFSRASWVAIIIGLGFLIYALGFSFIKKLNLVTFGLVGSVVIITAALSFFAYIPHRAVTGEGQLEGFFVRPGETKTTNNYVLRFMYAREALSYVPQYAPFGAGGRSYEQIMRLNKTSLEAWTIDPHSAPARFLLEYGVFSIGLYLFIAVFFVRLFLIIRHNYQISDSVENLDKVILASALSGAIAALAHTVVDVDWSYLQLVALFILTLSVMVGGEHAKKETSYVVIPYSLMSKRSVLAITALLVIGSVASAVALFTMQQTRSAAIAGVFDQRAQIPRFLYWVDPRIGVERGIAFMNDIMQGDQSLIPEAEREFVIAKTYSRFDSAPYFYLAELAYLKGNIPSAIDLYRKSIAYNKAGSYVERSRLLSLFVERHMVAEGVSLAKEGVSLYEPYMASLLFFGDPAKDDIRTHVSYWRNIIATAPVNP